MAINFPDSPTLNQVFSAAGRTWKWDGTTWVSVGAELVAADITDLTATATEINYTDGVTSAIQTQLNGKQAIVSGVSDTEIGYLDGVTSAIQTQLNGKASLSGGTFTGNVFANNFLASVSTGGQAKAAGAYSLLGYPETATNVGYMGIPSNGNNSGAYELVMGDAGEHIYTTASRTVTIPANASVPFPVGTTIVFISAAGATTTIAITSDTLILAGTGTTGSRTLAAHGMATAVKVASTTWYISGNGLS